MEYLFNGYTLDFPPGTFPLSTDSMLLADFAVLPRNASVLDLGAGCGTLGVLLCAKDPLCHVTGIELSRAAHDAAEDNIQRNGLSSRMQSICADLRRMPGEITPGSFHCCVSNPPYFSGGAASRNNPNARRDDLCSTEDLFAAAATALKFGGDFYLVHKPERLAQLCACAANAGLEPKRLRLIRHSPEKPVSLILLSCRKGAKPGLIWEESCLKESSGEPSEYYKRIYHL